MKYHLKTLMGTVIMLVVAFVLFGLAGSMDYEDAQAAEDHYTAMVCEGSWPDYKRLKPDCQ